MTLPFFFTAAIPAGATITLDEVASKHIVQVLRMQNGEALRLTDGKGSLYTASITDNNRKKCVVHIEHTANMPPVLPKVTIAISLLKNSSRFEWFLEKATELGVNEIVPLICTRTEKQHFRYERMHGILVSAMLQSQQVWLPQLHEPVKLDAFIASQPDAATKYIAHCEKEENKQLLPVIQQQHNSNSVLLIGPEGDFTTHEIALALQQQFKPVSLGNTRLRTETAGIVGAALLCSVR
ncbi:MAG TPA: RsmE family RNA methyltransferase [Ferruginibacter sp.]|nr:RsmE family RNA methyltransferase [Ferruginibacter sp.]HMP22394.1 RsmE family RNA methyltransferase [Ferruginibacter sp.]